MQNKMLRYMSYLRLFPSFVSLCGISRHCSKRRCHDVIL